MTCPLFSFHRALRRVATNRIRLVALLNLIGVVSAPAYSVRPLALDAHVSQSAVIFRGSVLENVSFRGGDGHIYTQTSLRVDEGIKGTFPPIVRLLHRGGVDGRTAEYDSASPTFTAGQEMLLFLGRREDGTLFALQGDHSARRLHRVPVPASGAARTTEPAPLLPPDEATLASVRMLCADAEEPGADVTDQAASFLGVPGRAARVAASSSVTGLILYNFEGDNYPSRFIQCDRGEFIPVLVDADQLPSGITLQQALAAVTNALNAWSAVSSLKFRIEGTASFGMAAANVNASDGRLRIQLHDAFNFINEAQVLGRGGALANAVPLDTHWGFGGRVGSQECHRSVNGSVVIKHADAFFTSNPVNFAQIVCHEIGHALGLAHSSNTSPENNPLLAGAIMYFQTSGGRGAVLGDYDGPKMRELYPSANTPPYAFDRVLRATSIFGGMPNVPGINEVEMRGYDLQPGSLTIETAFDPLDPGRFTVDGSLARYLAPEGTATDENDPISPESGLAVDRIYFRLSDGVNASPFNEVRVISLSIDTKPAGGGDGIPDNWQLANFGNIDPGAVANALPGDDFDGDGFTNFQEYLMGTDPKDAASKLAVVSFGPAGVTWSARPFELYEVQSSTDLTTWTLEHPAVVPVTGTGTYALVNTQSAQRFFRVRKVR